MAKVIRLTEELQNKLRENFEKQLREGKCCDGVFEFRERFNESEKRKATVYYTAKAWEKLFLLMENFETEVGWHGLARRGDDPEKDEYVVYDFEVYPQEVTGSTVNTDQIKYQDWLFAHEPEDFNHIRFHGHSHVRMGCSPSGTDIDHRKRILDQLEDGDFYIFMIWNKKLEYTAAIFDMQKNLMFETSDVSVVYLGHDFSYADFLKESKDRVSAKSYSSSYSGNYSGNYNGNYSGNYKGNGTYSTDSFKKDTPAASEKKEPAAVAPVVPVIASKKDGKKPIVRADQYDSFIDDDDDDMLSAFSNRFPIS